MNAILEQVNSMGNAFVTFALPMLVQSSVLIVVLLGLDLILRKRVKAVFRYWIWMIILVKLVLPTTLSSPTSPVYWFGNELRSMTPEEPLAMSLPTDTPIVTPTLANLKSPPASSADAVVPVSSMTWQGCVFLAWLAAVLIMTVLLIQRAFFVGRLIAESGKASDAIMNTLERAREQMGIGKQIALRFSPAAASPAVCGLLRPTILIPRSLPDEIDPRHLKSILLHELAHIKRADLWVNSIQAIVQIIYIYNPLLWVANAIIRKIREQAVDEMVLVAMGEKAEEYPRTLLNISKLAFGSPALSLRLIGVVESKKALIGRIRHITSRPFPKSARLGIGGLLVVAILSAALLPMARAEKTSESSADVATEDKEVSAKPLHEAVEKGDIEQVKLLVSKGADVNVKDDEGATPLHFAAKAGHKEVAEFLIAKGADLNSETNRGMGALHTAARHGHKDVVQIILQQGVDVDSRTKAGKGATPLYYATDGGHIEVVKFLLAQGADVNPRTGNKGTHLHAAAWLGYRDIVEILLINGADVNPVDSDGWTPVHNAIGNGKEDVANLIIAKGGEVRNERTGTTLHYAVQTNCFNVVEQLIGMGEDVNVKDRKGDTPLHMAARFVRESDMVELLIAKGADVKAINNTRRTPLHGLAGNAAPERAKLLIAQGADVNAKDENGSTPLHRAAKRGLPEVVQTLLTNGADVNARAKDGMSPVDEALRETFFRLADKHLEAADMLLANGAEISTIHLAVYAGDLDTVNKFIEQGVDVNAKHLSGLAPLHAAAKGGKKEAVKLLIAEGADVNAKGYKDRTPLHYAADAGRKDVVEQLIAQGADINAKCASGRMPLHYAALAGRLDVTRQLVARNADIEAKDSLGWEPLPYAMAGDHREIAQLLIERGADIHIKGPNGGGLLHLAAQLHQKNMIELLLAKGADVNAKGFGGRTCLHFLAQVGGNKEVAELRPTESSDIAELLLEKGANINAKDGQGKTPLDIAKSRGEQTELIELLQKHGAK